MNHSPLLVHPGITADGFNTMSCATFCRHIGFSRLVFFVENLGFITPTDARQISLADALRFERVHAEPYEALGYECVRIAPGPLSERVEEIKQSARTR
ncbi:MAG: AAA family ATPase [Luteitalea sp.]|nr:AAA family ATPase [Luteitalea sp.]